MKKLILLFMLILFSIPIKAQLKDKFFYSGSIILTLTHGGMVDALIWEPDKNDLPAFVRNDFVYLGGSLFVISANVFTANKWKSSSRTEFWLTTAGSILIGSVGWDWVFSELRYHDPFYPVPNWFGRRGFSRRKTRIAFDIGRLSIGVILILFSELIKK